MMAAAAAESPSPHSARPPPLTAAGSPMCDYEDKKKELVEKIESDLRRLFDWYVESAACASLNINYKYPVLSKLAKDILAVPVSTVASESSFSTGGRILDSFRTSLSATTVEALICTQSWLRSPSGPIDIIKSMEEIEAYEYIQEELLGNNSMDKY
ncbi:unnamed protein product [Urochloa humidicola]